MQLTASRPNDRSTPPQAAAGIAGFETLDAAADALTLHLGRKRMADTSGLQKAMQFREDGRYYWRWDPDSVRPEFLYPPSDEEQLRSAAAAIADPVVLVRAELSDVVTDASVQLFRQLAPQLATSIAKGVGHMFTGDRNDSFAQSLRERLGQPLVRRVEVVSDNTNGLARSYVAKTSSN